MSELSTIRQTLARVERQYFREIADLRERVNRLERANREQADRIALLQRGAGIRSDEVAA